MRPSSILALALLLPLLPGPALGAPADDPRPIVQASEILAKIERGEPVEYDGVIVEGDLDLSGLDLPTIKRTVFEIDILGLTEVAKIIESSISIRNSEIRGIVNFSGAQFSGYAGFYGVKFSGDAYFREAEFSGYADFYEAQFRGGAHFGEAEFSRYADFRNAKFSGDAAYFRKAKFSGYADFGRAEFSGYADFWRAQFNYDAGFYEAQFSGDAHFVEADFSGYAEFYYAKFSGYCNFWGADFSGALSLTGLDFARLYIDWSSIERPICNNGVTYLKLVQNFRDLEQFENADNCYYDYRRWRQREKSFLSWSKYVDILAWLSCGYGVRPGYALGGSLMLIIVFGIAFWKGNGIYRISSPYLKKANDNARKEWSISKIYYMLLNKISISMRKRLAIPTILWNIRCALSKMRTGKLHHLRDRMSTLRHLPGRILNATFVTNISFKDALYFSTMVFISMPPHDWQPKEGWKYAVMLEGVLGWLLLALFIVTLGNVMIR